MAYQHIDNLYKDTRILQFRDVYALEKIHGTSAHISWKDGQLSFFSGGEKHERFITLFDQEALALTLDAVAPVCTVYGEAYGGKCQGMKETYGVELRFIAFEVKIGDSWLAVPQAAAVVKSLGLEFVDYEMVTTSLEALDAVRDKTSTQATRNGIEGFRMREGVVLRPPFEVTLNNGQRLMVKHKRDDFKETKTPRVVGADLEVITEANKVAEEWVTPMRLSHILQKLPEATDMKHTSAVIKAMVEDVLREAEGEIVDSKAVRKAIGKEAGRLWKKHIQTTTFGQ